MRLFKKANHCSFFYKLAPVCLLMLIIIGCGEGENKHIKTAQKDDPEISNAEFSNFVKSVESLPLSARELAIKEFLETNKYSPVIENKKYLSFYWFGRAKQVLIRGDIQNAWSFPDTMRALNCGKNTFFYKTYLAPPDARGDYLYEIDGNLTLDPRNPVTSPSGYGEHSQFSMPEFKRSEAAIFNPIVKKGIIDTFYLPATGEGAAARQIAVYTSPGIIPEGDLPVIFIIDGFKALDYGYFNSVLDNLYDLKKLPPLIAVFIEYAEEDGNLFIDAPEIFVNYVCDKISPVVETRYRATRDPERRLICGYSAGAQVALLAALLKPDRFLKAAGQSTTITQKLYDTVFDLESSDIPNPSFKIYMDVGRYDLLEGGYRNYSFLYANQIVAGRLKSLGVNLLFSVYNQGHQWGSWRERTEDILIYFFGERGLNTVNAERSFKLGI